MQSLFKVNFNWGLYIGLLILLRFAWLDLSWFGFFALAITIHQFLILFFSIGSVVPIRYLLGAFMCLQMLVGPTLAYHGLDEYQNVVYQMKVPEDVYFSYVIPAVLCFILGLHITAKKLHGEVLELKAIGRFVDMSGKLPFIFVAIGFISSLIASYFSTSFGFVFYLLSSFKFVGAFMLLLGNRALKRSVLVLVFGSIILSSLKGAMFHDLLTWIIMTGSIAAIKYKPSIPVKAGVAFGFLLMAIVIQQLKGDYRKAAWSGGGGGVGVFNELYEKKQADNSIFGKESLARSNVRINQGFIITNIMRNVPAVVPHEHGAELLTILEAALLPRIIAPNKLNAGDRTIFMKYSGMTIQQGTSMALSSIGDAYINFGVLGGCIFMLIYGWFFSEVLNGFRKYSRYYPVLLLFTPLVFYYPIRPDCELQTSLGHLVKSIFLIYFIIKMWPSQFFRRRPAELSAEEMQHKTMSPLNGQFVRE